MTPRQLEIFHVLMQHGSIGDAARALRVSQPAVTKSLRLLEAELGLALFRRIGGRLFPSGDAELLAPSVAQVFAQLDSVARLSQEIRHGSTGRLEIAALTSITEALLPATIARLRTVIPKLQIEVMAMPTQQVVEHVAQRRADIGLVYDPSDHAQVEAEDLCEAEAVCAVPSGHHLASRPTLSPADLEGTPLIGYRTDTFVGARFIAALRASGSRRDFDVVTNYTHLSLRLVSNNVGVAVVDPFTLHGGAAENITAVPFRPLIPMRVRTLRARERPRSAPALAFMRALRHVVREVAHDSPVRVRLRFPRGQEDKGTAPANADA
jgi:DNA-binding transcriptional LysR family regulator